MTETESDPSPTPPLRREGLPTEEATASSDSAPPPFLGEGVGGRGASRRRIALGVAALALAAFAVWYFAVRTPEPRDDLGRFQGEWHLTVDGGARPLPVAVRVRGDRWVYLVGDAEQKRYALTLRPDADPKEIDLVLLGPDDQPRLEKHRRDDPFTPVTLRGIYTIENGKAKVLTAPSPQPRPTTFDAPDGPPVWLLEKL